MAITFLEKTKRQRNLIYIFIAVVLITSLTIWLGFLKPKKPSEEVIPPISTEKIEIDFEVLKNPFLEKLQIFEGLPQLPSEGKIGRENPFIPY